MSSNKKLPKDYMERKTHPLMEIKKEWKVDGRGQYFYVDLKMSQIKELEYDFEWGKEPAVSKFASTTESPMRILKLDLSLNELKQLEHQGLLPFASGLRHLDASLNKIENFIGIEVLKNIYSINLSHNFIKKIEGVVASSTLTELNLSMNELEDISYMPSLINLQILNINNNKLKSIEGVQSLPRLQELYCQRNKIKDILPLTSSLRLQILNASNNKISELDTAVGVLSNIKKLEVISFHGNPIDRDPSYQTEILRNTHVMTLDNVAVRPLPKQEPPSYDSGETRHKKNIESLKDAAKQAFEERMKESKFQMEENVTFLQRRIVELQNEYIDYEEKLNNDLNACLRYLDSLTGTRSVGLDGQALADIVGGKTRKPEDDTEDTKKRSKRRAADDRRDRPDYTHIKDTDEILRFVQKELTRRTPEPTDDDD